MVVATQRETFWGLCITDITPGFSQPDFHDFSFNSDTVVNLTNFDFWRCLVNIGI